jgi:hypothetical protein
MKLEIAKSTTETIEVPTPSYYKYFSMYAVITETLVMTVSEHSIWTVNKDDQRYPKEVLDVINNYWSTTSEEFEQRFNQTLKCLAEQYSAAINTNTLDPKEQAEQEQATENVENAGEVTEAPATEEGTGALAD